MTSDRRHKRSSRANKLVVECLGERIAPAVYQTGMYAPVGFEIWYAKPVRARSRHPAKRGNRTESSTWHHRREQDVTWDALNREINASAKRGKRTESSTRHHRREQDVTWDCTSSATGPSETRSDARPAIRDSGTSPDDTMSLGMHRQGGPVKPVPVTFRSRYRLR